MRHVVRFVIPAVLVLAVWLAWPYLESDKAQVARQHKRLFDQAAGRNWETVQEILAADYQDQWGLNRADAIASARDLLGGFIMLEIEWTMQEDVSVNDNIAKVRGTVRITGSGAGASAHVMSEVNKLTEPWVFTWRRDGRGPQGWKLVSVRNNGLDGVLPEELGKSE